MLYTNTKLYIKHIKNYSYKYVQIQKDVYEKLYENKKSYDKICKNSQKIKKINFGGNIGKIFGHEVLKYNCGENFDNIRVERKNSKIIFEPTCKLHVSKVFPLYNLKWWLGLCTISKFEDLNVHFWGLGT